MRITKRKTPQSQALDPRTRLFVLSIAGVLALLLSCSSDQVGYDVKFEVIPETKTEGPGCNTGYKSEAIPLNLVTYSEGIFGLLDCGTLNFRGEGDTSERVEVTGRADIWDACGEHFSWAEFKGDVPVGRYVITSEGVATDTMTGVVPVSFDQRDSERFFRYLMSDRTACATGPSRARAVFEWSVCGETTRDGMIRLVVEGTCKLAPPGGPGGSGGRGIAVCGDGVAEPPEPCDGVDLQGWDCTDFGFTGGSLACNATCDNFDLTGCAGGPVCGDNTIQWPEVCDGTDLDFWTCDDFGFTGGSLACNATCDNFDLTGCAGGPVCGDDTIQWPEVCDGTDLDFWTCDDFGFTGGSLACNATCDNFDLTGCAGGPVCGDDTIQWPEVCDGTDLDFWTCDDFGFTGGSPACNATCDNFDLTGCAGGPPGWTCPVFYYSDAYCVCGCGVIDPDCIDGTVASCDYCGAEGSCNPFGVDCPGSIVPAQNWLCSSQL